MATYISLTPAQEKAFEIQARGLVARIRKGDKNAHEELIKLAQEVADEPEEKNGGFLSDILDEAAEAWEEAQATKEEVADEAEIAQQEAEQDAEEKSRYTPEQTQANAARVISRYPDFADAVTAMEIDLQTADGQTASWVCRILAEAMKATREDGKWIFHSWVRNAMRTQRDQAHALANAKAEETTVKLFSWLCKELRTAEQSVSEADRVPKGVQAVKAKYARQAFDRALGIRFHGWALAAIERMAAGRDNPVSNLLCADPELARIVGLASEHQQAIALLEALKDRVRASLEALEEKIQGRQERSHEASARNRENRASRVGNGPQGTSGSKPGIGKGRVGPREAHDPNRSDKHRGRK